MMFRTQNSADKAPKAMLFFLDKFSDLKCHWNKKPLTDEDFYRLGKRHKITVQEMPLRVSGFYYCMLGRHYIAINSRLGHPKKLFVMFHEFAHYLIHAPDSGATANFHGIGKKTRKEFEADAFAVCALIPRPVVESRSVQDLIEVEGLPEELVRQRIDLLGLLSI
jgi:Zn-dependent peptidase ImmA (M78 family)